MHTGMHLRANTHTYLHTLALPESVLLPFVDESLPLVGNSILSAEFSCEFGKFVVE